MNNVTIIVPYINKLEVKGLEEFLGWKYRIIYKEDSARIGSDLMYQYIWNQCTTDIFILHADMRPLSKKWLKQVLSYVDQYPEGGIYGCKLTYPKIDDNIYIQSAGGYFDENNVPQHFGSGLDVETGNTFKEQLESDKGQYDKVREVCWTTFGGVYIKREVIKAVGDFDPKYEWSYNRDVDYCLEAREKGYKIYNIPVEIIHFESRDNKKLKQTNPELLSKESRNLKRLIKKWENSLLLQNIVNE